MAESTPSILRRLMEAIDRAPEKERTPFSSNPYVVELALSVWTCPGCGVVGGKHKSMCGYMGGEAADAVQALFDRLTRRGT